MSGEVESFTFDPRLLESLFSELAPPPEPRAAGGGRGGRLHDGRGLPLHRAVRPRDGGGEPRASRAARTPPKATPCSATSSAAQGAYGDALEKYRAARAGESRAPARAARRGADAAAARPRRGGARRRGARARRGPARRGRAHARRDVPVRGGRPGGARSTRSRPRARSRRGAPTCCAGSATSRARSATWTARSARTATRSRIDADFAAVRFDLARLLMQRELWPEAEQRARGGARRGADVRRGDARAGDAAPPHRAAAARRSGCWWTCCSATRTTSTRTSRSARRSSS